MTRLFIRIYIGVLVVLLAAWYIHGAISEHQFGAETQRITETAHRGGALLAVRELNAAGETDFQSVLESLQQRFDFLVVVMPLKELPDDARERIRGGEAVVSYNGLVAAPLASGTHVVRLGPFPRFTHYELSLRGGVRLAMAMIESSGDRTRATETLSDRFGYPVEFVSRDDVPRWEQLRVAHGDDVVFYVVQERAYVVAPMPGQPALLRFGPLPSYEGTEQRVLATTTAVVLLIAAAAIALLLRPVVTQLRRVENAAKAVADGDLSARVDEQRVRAAKPLAQAFNNMAGRTESVLRTQRELLQAVSHELRTPLSRIRFAIELIESARTDEERRERLASLDLAAEDLNELVGELLNYVRLETAEPEQTREAIAVAGACDVLVAKHASLYPAVEFDVSGLGAGAQAPVINADAAGFQRVVGNLLSNAGRFASRRVALSAQSVNGSVVLDVDDDGCGIPETERERIFEPFARLDRDNNGQGVGLGLAIVKRIVTQHKGDVQVLDNPDGGCRVRTIWPRCSELD